MNAQEAIAIYTGRIDQHKANRGGDCFCPWCEADRLAIEALEAWAAVREREDFEFNFWKPDTQWIVSVAEMTDNGLLPAVLGRGDTPQAAALAAAEKIRGAK